MKQEKEKKKEKLLQIPGTFSDPDLYFSKRFLFIYYSFISLFCFFFPFFSFLSLFLYSYLFIFYLKDLWTDKQQQFWCWQLSRTHPKHDYKEIHTLHCQSAFVHGPCIIHEG